MLLLLVFLTLLPLVRLLEIRFENRKLAKLWKPEFVENLMSSSNYKVLSQILKNPKYPFKNGYLEWCARLDVESFDEILGDLQGNQELLRQVLTVQCLDYSLFSSLLYNLRIASTNIQPFESSSLDPHEMSGIFGYYVQRVLNESDRRRLDLSNFCLASKLSPIYFEIDGIWRILGVKCLFNLLNSEIRDKNSVLNAFFNAFKFENHDSSKKKFLKLVALLAFKPRLRRSFFRDKLLAILQSYESFLTKQIETSDQWHQLSQMLLVSLNVSAFPWPVRKPAFSALIRIIHKALFNAPEADAAWLLSFAFVLKRYPQVMLASQSTYLLLNWFFRKNPSADEVCQLFVILDDVSYQSFFHKHLRKDKGLFELVLDKCPDIARETGVPLKMKLNRFLREKRNLGCRGTFYNADFVVPCSFAVINSVLLDSWSMLKSNYNALECTKDGYCYDGPTFFALWYDGLIRAGIYHHIIGIAADGKPVIIPSLLMPLRLASIFGQVVVRSIVYHAPLPFHLSKAYFEDQNSIDSYLLRLTNNRDSGILEVFSIPFNCSNERLELYLKISQSFTELNEPIEEELMTELSNLQRASFFDGIRNGFENKFSHLEIVKILNNKLF